MKPSLIFSFGYSENPLGGFADIPAAKDHIVSCDLYALPELELDRFSSLLISMHSDQQFLAAQADRIATFVRDGGTVVANGHFAYPFLPGMIGFHTVEDCHLKDLAVVRVADHPIWSGVSERDLTFRRGVAGFYARVWHDAPAEATVIHALGHADRPIDILYPVGNGRILFHGGNDLWQFRGSDTTAQIGPQLLQWLFPGERVS